MKTQSTRRAILSGLAAAPIAGLPALAAGGELATLIARYSNAIESFHAAADELERVEMECIAKHGFKAVEHLALIDPERAAQRKEAFGLAPAERRWHAADAAEIEAGLALCSYRCRNLEEARIKAAAILKSPIVDNFEKKFSVALCRSFLEVSA